MYIGWFFALSRHATLGYQEVCNTTVGAFFSKPHKANTMIKPLLTSQKAHQAGAYLWFP